jgi:uncharacterized protein (TIGR02265 family)
VGLKVGLGSSGGFGDGASVQYRSRVRHSEIGSRPPRFSLPIDLEGHVAALPEGATVKGMFLRDLIALAEEKAPGADVFALAGVPKKRILPFFDYPYEWLLRLLVATSKIAFPDVPTGEGVRRLGHRAYEALVSEQLGRVLFAVLGNDFARVVGAGVKGWRLSVSFGKVDLESLGEGHALYRFRDFPAFLETYQVGVIEGAMHVAGVRGEVWCKLESMSDGVLELFWE